MTEDTPETEVEVLSLCLEEDLYNTLKRKAESQRRTVQAQLNHELATLWHYSNNYVQRSDVRKIVYEEMVNACAVDHRAMRALRVRIKEFQNEAD